MLVLKTTGKVYVRRSGQAKHVCDVHGLLLKVIPTGRNLAYVLDALKDNRTALFASQICDLR